MSHPEQREFVRLAYQALPADLLEGKVLEVGSYDVNGTVREIFAKATEYVGVDISEGPSVDLVCFGHDISLPDNSFNVSLSFNCFEHDIYWAQTFKNMVRLTAPGGAVIFTCPSKGFPEHGTRRSDPDLSPGNQSVGLDYYRNLSEADFMAVCNLGEIFMQYKFWNLASSCDLFFIGQISDESANSRFFQLPTDVAIYALNDLMPLSHKVARIPLRFASRLLPEPAFQTFASRYWKYLNRIQRSMVSNRFAR